MITIGELKKIIANLPNSMPVVLGVDDSLEDICSANIEVLLLEFTDDDDPKKGTKEKVLVLPVCTCEEIGEFDIDKAQLN